MQTKITKLLRIDIPIVQAPMGYIARAQLASAVSNAGGLGIEQVSKLYFEGDMEAAFAFAGQVSGRVNIIRPVAEILSETWQDCQHHLKSLGDRVK